MKVLEKEKGFIVFVQEMAAMQLDAILKAGARLADNSGVVTAIREEGAPVFDAVFFIPVGPDAASRERVAKALRAMDVID